MKTRTLVFPASLFLFLALSSGACGQEKKSNYGNTPDEMVPFSRFHKAYKNFFDDPQEYLGPGRDKPPPENLGSVRIGFLGPLEGSVMVPQGMQMLQGALLAIEEANRKGGYRGIPYELMEHNDVGLWGAAANEVVRMNDEGVWGFLGTIDDINSHVALRAALKIEVMMVNTGDPDPTLTETRIPWLIRCISDDRQSSYALVDYIYTKEGHDRVAVIRADNRYGRVGTMEFKDAALRIGHPIILEVRFADGDTSFTVQLERMKELSPDAVLIWGNARESALVLNQLRQMGMEQPVFASDRVVSPDFLGIAGKNAEGIVATCQYDPGSDDPAYTTFKADYMKRFNQEPDVFAAHAYDGMTLLLKAIEKAGLNRALIRDVLTDLNTFQGYHGVTGEIVLDASWNDIGRIWYAKIRGGRFSFTPAIIE